MRWDRYYYYYYNYYSNLSPHIYLFTCCYTSQALRHFFPTHCFFPFSLPVILLRLVSSSLMLYSRAKGG